MKKSSVLLSSLMLFAAANSVAVSLGRHRGAALVGRPLDLSVQAVLDAQEELSSLCLDADVFYADNRVNKSSIRVTAEKGAAGAQDTVIRIRSSALVDEPVVTVYLRVGCQQKIERRYVTLADLASDAVPDRNAPSVPFQQAQPPQVLPKLATLPAAAPTASNSPTPNSPGTKRSRRSPVSDRPSDPAGPAIPAGNGQVANTDQQSRAEKREKRKQERAAALARDKNGAANSGSINSGATNRARLKLEPLDLSIERDPQLKSSAELLSAPAANPQERSAAAALWRAISAQPQDIMRDLEKLQTLESSVRSMQAQGKNSQLAINEMADKLQKAESERYANALVYALVALLLLALAGLAYLLRGQFLRRRLAEVDTPWWRKSESPPSQRKSWSHSGAQDDIFGSDRDPIATKRKSAVSLKAGSAVSSAEADLYHAESSPEKQISKLGPDSASPPAAKYSADFAVSMTHPSRAVKAEELFDVQQQADFFVSIGQREQAIDVLRSHIGDGAETSALVYLDLFNLYHQLQRQDDYAELREDFNSRFNTEIPEFDLYTDTGPGLEAYQVAMSRIEALWPSPKVLELIEESIFRRPDNNAEAFNLAAYRELLLLYSVAKEIISPDSKGRAKPTSFDLPATLGDNAASRPMTFASTAIQPLSASIDDGQFAQPRAAGGALDSTRPPASLHLGLDLDLSEPMPATGKALAVDTIDVSDSAFFDQLDEGATAASPTLNAASNATKKTQENSSHLIEFDAFDSALSTGKKAKPPKA